MSNNTFRALTPEESEQLQIEADRIDAPITDDEILVLKQQYIDAGMPEHLWSHLAESQPRYIVRNHRMGMGLMSYLMLDLPLDTSSPPVKVPTEVARTWASYTMIPRAYYCITEGESWWPFERSFLCDTYETTLKLCIYLVAKRHGNKDAVKHLVKKEKRPVGRPADPLVAERREAELAYKREYAAWLDVCMQRKATRLKMEETYKEEREALKLAREQLNIDWEQRFKAFDAATVPMPRKPS